MLFNLLLRALFPVNCAECGKKTEKDMALCKKCLDSIPTNDFVFCGRCHARLPEGKKICHFNTPFILLAATNYRLNPPIQKIIRRFKFRHSDWIGETLGKLICPYATKVLPNEDFLICPIPLGKRRLHRRGFNQAEILANIIARELKIPVEKNALKRVKETEAQTLQCGLKNRELNLENAFWADASKVKDRNILLVDDVTTTGATLISASKTLKDAGANKIYALVGAKAG